MAVKLTLENILMLEEWREELDADKFKLMDLETHQYIDTSSALFQQMRALVKKKD